jgi:hypothetical protein
MNPAVGQSPGPASRARTSLEFVGDTRQVAAVARNVPFASTSKDFRAALLQRSASSRRRPEQSVTGMGSRSRLVDRGACPDWSKIQVSWFDHLAPSKRRLPQHPTASIGSTKAL